MPWWGWIIVAVVVIAVALSAVAWVQARRRTGGVIVGGVHPEPPQSRPDR
jgi:hypothetical protein